jgi:hypothetical protein
VQDQTHLKQTAAALGYSVANLECVLHTWHCNFSHLKLFVYPLEHRYTEASLSLNNLKGYDATKGRHLERLCAKNGFYWFLAQMTKENPEEYSDYEDVSDDDVTSEIRLGKFITPSGTTVSIEFKTVHEEQILANINSLYGSRSPDSEDEGEYTGNENMPSNFRYHNTVAVLVRKEFALGVFGSLDQSPASLMTMFELLCNDESCTVELRRIGISTILGKALEMIIHGVNPTSTWDYRREKLLGNGEDRVQRGVAYSEVFRAIADFCQKNNLTDLVSAHLHKVMENQQIAKPQVLVDLVANQVAKEVADGDDEAWSRWSVA